MKRVILSLIAIIVIASACSKDVSAPASRIDAKRNSIQTVADTTFKLPVLKWKR